MRITKIVINDHEEFKDFNIELSYNNNYIIGKAGSRKTSLLKLISNIVKMILGHGISARR